MRPHHALHLIHPGALRPAIPGRDAQALALLRLLYGCDPRSWARELAAIYHADDRDSTELARALADRLWLRPRVLLPQELPAAHWAGALDQLGRQHADRAVIVVAPHATIGAAVTRLLRLQRARELSEQTHPVRRLTLVDERAAHPSNAS